MTYHDPHGQPHPPQQPSIYAQDPHPAPPGSGYGPGRPPMPYEFARPTNTMATVAVSLGIAGFFLPLLCIGAVITGHLARREIRRTGEAGNDLALVGLILGWIAVTIHVFFALFILVFILTV